MSAEVIARAFHESYERLAVGRGYKTRRDTAVLWTDLPEVNRGLMVAVVADLLARGVIVAGQS